MERKSSKRKSSRRKSSRRKVVKRKSSRRKSSKRKVVKRKSSRRKSSKPKGRRPNNFYVKICTTKSKSDKLFEVEKELLKRKTITFDGRDYGKNEICLFLNVYPKSGNIKAVEKQAKKYKLRLKIY